MQQKKNKDSFTSVTHVVYALLQNEAVKSALKKKGINTEEIMKLVKKEIESQKVISKTEETDSEGSMEFGKDLVQSARDGLLDPVIGREKEIWNVITILSKKEKSNPMLVGDAGVGKTAIVNAIAHLIANNKISTLSHCKIYSLDIGAIVAGTKYRGQFEERIKKITQEAKKSKGSLILFIDEIHMILGAGGADGSTDAANMLKPGLASGEIRCIGATTTEEYSKYIERDPALERRFTRVDVSEPSVEDTITILRGLRERYESYHGITILDESLCAAAEMAKKYMTGGHMPDTAITLMDSACSSVKVSVESEPSEILEIRSKVMAAELEKRTLNLDMERTKNHDSMETYSDIEKKLEKVNRKIAVLESDLNNLVERYRSKMGNVEKTRNLKQKLEHLKVKLANAEADGKLDIVFNLKHFTIPDLQKQMEELEKKGGDERIIIKPENIAEIVSNFTGIPTKRLTVDENDRLLEMKNRIRERVIGQDAAIEMVTDAIIRSRVGYSRTGRPLGSFLFLGPTGVGKTELAKALAYELFDDEKAMVVLDMSEYMEPHSVSRLIGAPPGYVGYETGGYLTERVKKRPYNIILIDEIEKADSRVHSIFLQLLDEGRLTDGKGKSVNFTNCVLIMTSNIGSDIIMRGGKAGEEEKSEIMKILPKHFLPEFLNRLDSIEFFNPLSQEMLSKIINLSLRELNERFKKDRIRIMPGRGFVEKCIRDSFSPVFGARPLKTYLEKNIVTAIATLVLSQRDIRGRDVIVEEFVGQEGADHVMNSFAYFIK